MTTASFFELLETHSEKELWFEYSAETFVPKAYHITEVKNVHIESVDCGGRPDAYDQTIVQLWINDGEVAERAMSCQKANKIFKMVDHAKPIKRDTPIFFEWGYGDLRTSVYEVEQVNVVGNRLEVQLFVPPTVCKPALEVASTCSPSSGCCG